MKPTIPNRFFKSGPVDKTDDCLSNTGGLIVLPAGSIAAGSPWQRLASAVTRCPEPKTCYAGTEAYAPTNTRYAVARVLWGIGPATFMAYLDIGPSGGADEDTTDGVGAGLVFSATCDRMVLEASNHSVTAMPIHGGIGPGMHPTPVPHTYTSRLTAYPAASATVGHPIPPWARRVWVERNPVSQQLTIDFADAVPTAHGGQYILAANTRQRAPFPVNPRCTQIRITNAAGSALTGLTLSWELAI